MGKRQSRGKKDRQQGDRYLDEAAARFEPAADTKACGCRGALLCPQHVDVLPLGERMAYRHQHRGPGGAA
jgi:hypothetical protein